MPFGHLTCEAAEAVDDEQEHDLILRCQKGDADAMEQLVRRYQDWVYNIAYGMLGNPEDASDLTQNVFLTVWEKIEGFRFRSRFSTWLYRMVVNLAINEKNRQKVRQTVPLEMHEAQAFLRIDTMTPEKAILRAEQQDILHTALARIRENYREILILREMQDLSYAEIAEVLGCSIGRVRSRLYKARKALEKILKRLVAKELI